MEQKKHINKAAGGKLKFNIPSIIQNTPKSNSQKNQQNNTNRTGTKDELVTEKYETSGKNTEKRKLTNINEVGDLAKFLLENISNDIEIDRRDENIQLPEFKDVPNDALTVKKFIAASLSLSNDLIKRLREQGMENYIGTEVFLMLDIGFTISNRQRTALFILYCAFAIALSVLRIPTSLSIFSDPNIQVEIKSQDKELTEVDLQKVLDTLSIRRKVSDIVTATEFVKRKFSENAEAHSLFVFTDGLLVNTNVKNWNDRIPENATLTTIILPQKKDETIRGLKNAYAPMTKIEGFKYFILESEDDIFNSKDNILTSFTSGIKRSKATQERKQIVNVIIPKDPIMIKERFINKKDNEEQELLFTSKKESYSSESVRLPQVLFDDKYDEFIVQCQTPDKKNEKEKYDEFSLDAYSDPLKEGISIRPLFNPNKPTQATPSEKGFGISLIGLIRCTITNGQDKRIYLEKNSGYIPSYSIFVVVDCTPSTCSFTTLRKSINTIVSLLAALSRCESSPLTLIAATGKGPVVLCMNAPVENVFKVNSPVILSLIQCMKQPSRNSSVSDALNAACTLRSKQQELDSVCFVFTDGELYGNEKLQTMSIINALEVLKTNVIGVGIGVCPSSIETIFKSSIWTNKPTSIPKALYHLIKNEKCNDPISYLKINKPSPENIEECVKLVETDKPIFTEFINKLSKTHASLTSSTIYVNGVNKTIAKEKVKGRKAGNGKDALNNDSNDDNDLGKGKVWNLRILICQFWDYSISKEKEDPNITYDVLTGKYGIVEALTHLGIKVDVVQNYREAISCLISGAYNQAWVICGRGNKNKPKTRPIEAKPLEAYNDVYPEVKDDFKLAIAFVDTLELFRVNGGGISFWADKGFTYELNYYLSRVKLYNHECLEGIENPKKVKVNLKFDKEDNSYSSHLNSGPIFNDGKFKCIKQTFDLRDAYDFSYITRRLFGYNVMNLYEGDTIACADPKLNIEPFKPFSFSTKGFISNAYYMAPVDSNEGDIIIDGAASRLFIDTTKEGIKRLVRNMAVWLTSQERYMFRNMDAKAAISVKPDQLEPIELPKEKVETYKKPIFNELDIAFVFDATASTQKIKYVLEDIIQDLIKFIGESYTDKTVRAAAIYFRDYSLACYRQYDKASNKKTEIDKNRGDKINFLSIPAEREKLVAFVKDSKPQGGCNDGPEDWVYAFNEANSLNWTEKSKKILVFLTDSGGHGTNFHDGFNTECYDEEMISRFDAAEQPKLIKSLGKLADKNVELLLIGTSDNAKKGFEELINTYRKMAGYGMIDKFTFNCSEYDANSTKFCRIKKTFSDRVKREVETFMAGNSKEKIPKEKEIPKPVKQEYLTPREKTPCPEHRGENQRGKYKRSVKKQQPQMYSLQPQMYSLQPQMYSLQPQMYSLQPQMYSQQPQMYSLQQQMYSLQPQMYSLQPQMYSLQQQMYSLQQQMYSQQPQMYSLQQQMYSQQQQLYLLLYQQYPQITPEQSQQSFNDTDESTSNQRRPQSRSKPRYNKGKHNK